MTRHPMKFDKIISQHGVNKARLYYKSGLMSQDLDGAGQPSIDLSLSAMEMRLAILRHHNLPLFEAEVEGWTALMVREVR